MKGTKPPPPGQEFLPLDYAPTALLEHGYRDAHTRPLVSWGKDARGRFTKSFRVHPADAWDFPSVELRAANSWPVLIFDLDGAPTLARARRLWLHHELPPPSWIVQRGDGGGHAAYGLLSPVHRGPQAREAPLRLAARVSEYLAVNLRADAGYNGVLAHNPEFDGQLLDGERLYTTYWASGYQLKELAQAIPRRWRKPANPVTEIGRNCHLFAAGMKWAGSYRNLGHQALGYLEHVNADYTPPLGAAEVQGIARSVERYRATWEAQGRFYTQAERTAWGSAMGKAAGLARRLSKAERDKHIVNLWREGVSKHQIARVTGLSRHAVRHVIARDGQRPLQGGGHVLHR